MGEIDGRHNERNERVSSVVFGVGEDGEFGFHEFEFCIISY